MKTPHTSGSSLTIDAHLPLDRRRALVQGSHLPEHAPGSVLFADLSGFTPLMEHLANALGPRRGAEELTLLLNSLFTALIAAVHVHGGSIVAFGGDALTCYFPGEPIETARGAVSAALAMQQHTASFASVDLARHADPIGLSMHIGIASGLARRFLVGQPPYGLRDVLAGPPIVRMAEAQERAESGQIAVDTTTADLLPKEALEPLTQGFARVREDAWMPLETPADALSALPPLSPEQVNPWLAEPLYRRLQAGGGAFTAELRLVSSIFVQFNGLDYEHDLEVGQKLQRYVSLTQTHLAPYEGHLAMVACGDKGSLMLILFGAPLSHEDDPTRAVGFALEFREAVQTLPFIQGQRIGISLGRVYAGILGSPQRCTYTVLGDEVNLSARLMQAAQRDQILVSRRIQQAAAADYCFSSLRTIALKGKERPVPIYEPVASQEPALRYEEGRLVGREEPWKLALRALEHVAAGQGHILQLAGEAGVGKSAFARALIQHAQQRAWATFTGTCLSYGSNTPYLPWRVILEQAAGLTPGMEPAEGIALLEQKVAAIGDPPGRPNYWKARFPLLAEAMGRPVRENPLTRSLEGELRRDNTFQILETLLLHLAADRPAMVVLEDVQWADELSLALAAQTGRNLGDASLLLVFTHRPFTDTIPPAMQALQGLEERTSLTLSVLSQESALELARQRLQGAELPLSLKGLLQQRAQGNPFFIEELLRTLQEAKLLRTKSDPAGQPTIELTGDLRAVELPDTIEGIVQARMDLLPESERLTLKVASVIGRVFQRPLLRRVHPAQPGPEALIRHLVFLGKADFTQLEQSTPEWRYAFRQTILHEVTYETLLFTQRRQLHGAIGAILEESYAQDIPRVLDLLAYHYSRSEEREKAIHYLQQAGDKARREYANEVALGYYSQALEKLLPEEQALRYEILAGRERIYDLLGERSAQEADLQQMDQLAHALADRRRQADVSNRAARRAADMGAFAEAQELAHRALDWAQEAGDLFGAAEAQKTLGIVHANQGEYEPAHRFFNLSLETFQKLDNLQGETACLSNLGVVQLYQGNSEQAQDSFSRALELTRMLDNRQGETQALINLGLSLFYQGALERALYYLHQSLTISREIGNASTEVIALTNIGALAMNLGDLERAFSHHQQALLLARRLGDRVGEAESLSNLGTLAAYNGELKEALSLVQESLRGHQKIGYRRGVANALHAQGIIQLWAGNPVAAQASLHETVNLRQEIGEAGNAMVAKAWLSLAYLATGEANRAHICAEQVLSQLEAEEYGGDYPEQEIWWAVYQVRKGHSDVAGAAYALERAHTLIQVQAGRIQDPVLRELFLKRVPVNRETLQEWTQVGRGP
jgi:predicted ATPase/class 3 adenylate cyclase